MKKHGCLWWLFIGCWWVPIALPIRILMALVQMGRKYTAGTDESVRRLPPLTPPSEEKHQPEVKRAEPVPKSAGPLGKEETHRVAGVSFRQDAIKALGVKNPDFAKSEKALKNAGMMDECVYEYEFAPQRVELIPEPDNPHDPKAIKVVVDGTHIGYIKAGSCAHIHKLLEADRILRISCFIGGGKSKMLYWDDIGEQEDLFEDETPFHARLTITTKEA